MCLIDLILIESGNIYCWGDNDFGACGYLNSTTGIIIIILKKKILLIFIIC